jgi:hypothetical protein
MDILTYLKEVSTALFENTFVRTIVIPLLLTIFTALVEYQLKLVNGRADGKFEYVAWIRQKELDGSNRIVPRPQQSLEKIIDDVKSNRYRLVKVEQMFSFKLSEFNSLAIDLVIGALAVDIASLFNTVNRQENIAGIIVAHIGMMVTVQLLLIQSQKTHFQKVLIREFLAFFAISVGFLAMVIAFIAI